MNLKIDLKHVLLLLVIGGLTVIAIKQTVKKNDYKEKYTKSSKKIEDLQKFTTVITEDNFVLQTDLKSKVGQLSKLKASHSVLEAQVASKSIEEDYAFLSGLNEATDTLKYCFDSAQVKKLRMIEFEMERCNDIQAYLTDEVFNSYSAYTMVKANLNVCNQDLDTCEEQSEVLGEDNKKLKRRSRRRGLWGIGATGLLVLLAL